MKRYFMLLLHAIKVEIQGLQQQEQSVTHRGFLFSLNSAVSSFSLSSSQLNSCLHQSSEIAVPLSGFSS